MPIVGSSLQQPTVEDAVDTVTVKGEEELAGRGLMFQKRKKKKMKEKQNQDVWDMCDHWKKINGPCIIIVNCIHLVFTSYNDEISY